jgi:glycosyltransferase involved in cell wall biosynthesis
MNIEKNSKCKLSIGIPVFNSEKFLRKCLDSLLSQTFSNFEIIISDNASIDLTSKICEEYKKKDNRIVFFQQKSNIGIVSNFNFVLQHANNEYFMWAAADDIWHPEFIEKNIISLEKNPDFIGSTSEIKIFYEPWKEENFEKFKKSKKKFELVHPIKGNYEEKVKILFNSGKFEWLYAIYRTKYLKKSMIKRKFLTWELPIILKILKYGDLNVEEGVMMYKYMGGKTNTNFYKKLFSTTKNYWKYGTLNSLFPFVPLTLSSLTIVGPRIFVKHLLKRFIKDNYRAQRLVFLEIFLKK